MKNFLNFLKSLGVSIIASIITFLSFVVTFIGGIIGTLFLMLIFLIGIQFISVWMILRALTVYGIGGYPAVKNFFQNYKMNNGLE